MAWSRRARSATAAGRPSALTSAAGHRLRDLTTSPARSQNTASAVLVRYVVPCSTSALCYAKDVPKRNLGGRYLATTLTQALKCSTQMPSLPHGSTQRKISEVQKRSKNTASIAEQWDSRRGNICIFLNETVLPGPLLHSVVHPQVRRQVSLRQRLPGRRPLRRQTSRLPRQQTQGQSHSLRQGARLLHGGKRLSFLINVFCDHDKLLLAERSRNWSRLAQLQIERSESNHVGMLSISASCKTRLTFRGKSWAHRVERIHM